MILPTNDSNGSPSSRLAQRNDEIRSFTGLTGGDALVGNNDRAAGRKRISDSSHGIRRDGEAIQRLGGAIGLWPCDLGTCDSATTRAALILVPAFSPLARRQRDDRPA